MKLGFPLALWFFFGLPIYLLLVVNEVQARKKRMTQFSHPGSWETLSPGVRFDLAKRRLILMFIGLFFAIVAATRPQWGETTQETKTTGMDILFALDLSRSMDAEDIAPDRLRKAKHIIRTISEDLEGDRVGLIGFAGVSDLIVPLTTDIDYFQNRLQTVDTRDLLIQGTDVGAALKLATTTFERGGESLSSGASRVLILLTDGEDHEERAIGEASKLKDQGIHFFVIGVGNESGGLIPLKDAGGTVTGYKRDESGRPITTKPNFQFLKELAEKAEGVYYTATTTESEAYEIKKTLNQLERGELAARKIPIYEERFQIPLALAIFFLLLDFSLPVISRAQRRFAKVLGLAMLCITSPKETQASEWKAYRENHKAIEALKAKQTEQGFQHFDKAYEWNPQSPLHQYNRGTMNIQKNPEQSITDLDSSAKIFRRQQQYDMAARSKLNQGLALQEKKDLPAAALSYLEALKDAQIAKDRELETKARKALELLTELTEQQNQQKQQNQNQNKENQNEKDEQNKNQKQDQKQEGDKDKKFKQNQKQAFRSEKLSKQDAERVLNELFNREKEVHSRLKERKQQPMKRKTQDW
jgi:Ca-activated chloride channel family protein